MNTYRSRPVPVRGKLRLHVIERVETTITADGDIGQPPDLGVPWAHGSTQARRAPQRRGTALGTPDLADPPPPPPPPPSAPRPFHLPVVIPPIQPFRASPPLQAALDLQARIEAHLQAKAHASLVGTGIARCNGQLCVDVLSKDPSATMEALRDLPVVVGGPRFRVLKSGEVIPYTTLGASTPSSPVTSPPAPSSSISLTDLVKQAAPVAKELLKSTATEDVETLRAQIKNHAKLRDSTPEPLKTFYANKVEVLRAKLKAALKAQGLEDETTASQREWRVLGKTLSVVGIAAGASLVLALLAAAGAANRVGRRSSSAR